MEETFLEIITEVPASGNKITSNLFPTDANMVLPDMINTSRDFHTIKSEELKSIKTMETKTTAADTLLPAPAAQPCPDPSVQKKLPVNSPRATTTTQSALQPLLLPCQTMLIVPPALQDDNKQNPSLKNHRSRRPPWPPSEGGYTPTTPLLPNKPTKTTGQQKKILGPTQ
jgi:hypothetical protein